MKLFKWDLKLVLSFEERWFQMRVDTNRQRRVAPADLTDADRAGMNRWRHHLGAVVDYDTEGCGGVRCPLPR
jgi:hypothetical protein